MYRVFLHIVLQPQPSALSPQHHHPNVPTSSPPPHAALSLSHIINCTSCHSQATNIHRHTHTQKPTERHPQTTHSALPCAAPAPHSHTQQQQISVCVCMVHGHVRSRAHISRRRCRAPPHHGIIAIAIAMQPHRPASHSIALHSSAHTHRQTGRDRQLEREREKAPNRMGSWFIRACQGRRRSLCVWSMLCSVSLCVTHNHAHRGICSHSRLTNSRARRTACACVSVRIARTCAACECETHRRDWRACARCVHA